MTQHITETQKQKTFLETLVSTRNFNAAVKAAGYGKAGAEAALLKYSNIYKAMFARLGLSEDDVFKELKTMILNPEEPYTRDGITKYKKDRRTQLAAIEVYAKLVGMITAGVSVQINQGDAKAQSTKVYDALRELPNFDEIENRVLSAIDTNNKEAEA